MHLQRELEEVGELIDLERFQKAISIVKQAIQLDGEGIQPGILDVFGEMITRQLNRRIANDVVECGVDATGMVLDAISDNHPDRASWLYRLGYWHGLRYHRLGSMDDLNRAVELTGTALDLTPHDDPNRAEVACTLGDWLEKRFKRTDAREDIDRAVAIATTMVDVTAMSDPKRSPLLFMLKQCLDTRFERFGLLDDVNQLIVIAEAICILTIDDEDDRSYSLTNLGTQLAYRFDQTGSLDDLKRAISLVNEAVDSAPEDDPGQGDPLYTLAGLLYRLSEETGLMDDLNRAVAVATKAVDATPPDDPKRVERLSRLGSCLSLRFLRTAFLDDLNRAIDASSTAVDAVTKEHHSRPALLINLGTLLGSRFERTGSIKDIDRAVDVTEMGVEGIPKDHPSRIPALNSLGNWLSTRFAKTGVLDDINRAINVAETATDATHKNDPSWLPGLNNLAVMFGRRFERTASIEDVNRAVEIAKTVVDATPKDHAYQARWLSNLGAWLHQRSKATNSPDDLEDAVSAYKKGWACHTSPPSVRAKAALEAAQILAGQKDWEGASSLLHGAVGLLPTVSPRTIKDTDKQDMLSDFAGLASMAAATSLHTGKDAYHALKLLELGRGVIAGLLMDTREDVSDVEREHPGLAQEFIALREELSAPFGQLPPMSLEGHDAISWEVNGERRREANRIFGELVERIRAQPGFEHFLQLPTVEALMGAAEPGPIVVVNLSAFRCDAFMVTREGVDVLPLPELALEDVRMRAKMLGSDITSVLAWLWRVIVGPCLDALGFTRSPSGSWPRIWWVPTGALSGFPLHAAGRYVEGSRETALDRVVSSYSSSIRALLHGRRQSALATHRERGDALLVGMHETPGNSVLSFAKGETDMLERLCPSLQLSPVKPRLCHREVLESLRSCKIFHFAGHGVSHPSEPLKSCLLLDDWKTDPLTVADLREQWLQENTPFMAYLSACSTGANKDEDLADETIHLINACQLAGFCHVVGTLWDVDDECSLDAARSVYEAIQRHGWNGSAVAQGVHDAANHLHRKTGRMTGRRGLGGVATREEGDPSVWAAYIHVGP